MTGLPSPFMEESSQCSRGRPLIFQKAAEAEYRIQYAGLNHTCMLGNKTWWRLPPHSQIYIQLPKLDVRFLALPFFHGGPIAKLIPMIIERGFNEGEALLTFECHGLLRLAACCPAPAWR